MAMNLTPYSGGVGNQIKVSLPSADKHVPNPKSPSVVDTSILRVLYIPGAEERRSNIRDVGKDAFEWIFRDTGPWSRFTQWLENGSGCYWVSGKTGSGKSTFMKYIIDDPRTTRCLLSWAGKDQLTIPYYFFWRHGGGFENSYEGLFKSILFLIICQHQDLIPVVSPYLSTFSSAAAPFSEFQKPSKLWLSSNSCLLRFASSSTGMMNMAVMLKISATY